MQPCHVCGGMAVDHNGFCTQCGTYRGQITQPAPASGAPWPGQSSGAPWPGQSSAAPYPPPPPPQRRPVIALLIAGCAVAVVLIGAIVVVALARSGKQGGDGTSAAGGTTPGPAATGAIDPCLVGTWKATQERQQQDYPGVGTVTLVGSGVPLSVSSDPVQYTCGSKTATEHTDHYDVNLTKLSDSP
jgi:hypothetical protein